MKLDLTGVPDELAAELDLMASSPKLWRKLSVLEMRCAACQQAVVYVVRTSAEYVVAYRELQEADENPTLGRLDIETGMPEDEVMRRIDAFNAIRPRHRIRQYYTVRPLNAYRADPRGFGYMTWTGCRCSLHVVMGEQMLAAIDGGIRVLNVDATHRKGMS